ncbi:hypothetical protein FB45DRAFT_862981 [Roridomyces roridus]|uniref:F-box domain-containing protein n=1 Tax=Roridomyces roridus TaxID=1738132 RepID=A0AAD7C8P7_9AGAR|nr:hypothetical protein FB45DRAFT_862981 [Roridomyces roridus]
MSAPMGLLDCPPELIHEIAKQSTRADLRALAFVGNKGIYKICIPYQYHNATIQSLAGFFRFCETLAMESNAGLADCVKTLRFFTREANGPSSFATEQIVVCATCIGKLDSLHSLELLHPLAHQIIPRIHHVAFPLLHTFAAPFSIHLDQFLRSNPHIQHLNIPKELGYPPHPSAYPTCVLARAVIPHSRVTEPVVIWDHKLSVERVRETLSCIAQSAAAITGLRNYTYGWPPNLPNLIAQHPGGTNLQVLEFRNYRPEAGTIIRSTDFFLFLDWNIHPGRFPKLTTLLIHNAPTITRHCSNTLCPSALNELFEEEWAWINLYSQRCPELDDITFLAGIQWQRGTGGRWIPVGGEGLYNSEKFQKWFERKFGETDFF